MTVLSLRRAVLCAIGATLFALILAAVRVRASMRAAAVHSFVNDAFAVDVHLSTLFRPKRFAQVAMEVRRVMLLTDSPLALGVFVADGAHFEVGDLVGCYTGDVVHGSVLVAKKQYAPSVDEYLYDLNETHFVDPTSATGRVADTDPPFRVEMAAVNEPSSGPPNVTPLDYAYGLCHDRWGARGVPYYAMRRIDAGEEVLVCYGPGYVRRYASDCGDARLADGWERQSYALIRPFLHVQQGTPRPRTRLAST